MEPCKYCSEDCWSSTVLSRELYVSLELLNINGDVAIVANGSNSCSYRPKFCPECGRKLIEEDTN